MDVDDIWARIHREPQPKRKKDASSNKIAPKRQQLAYRSVDDIVNNFNDAQNRMIMEEDPIEDEKVVYRKRPRGATGGLTDDTFARVFKRREMWERAFDMKGNPDFEMGSNNERLSRAQIPEHKAWNRQRKRTR